MFFTLFDENNNNEDDDDIDKYGIEFFQEKDLKKKWKMIKNK